MVHFQSWRCIFLWCAIYGPLLSRGLNPTIAGALQRAEVDQRLRVHIVPHTHDDSGWLKTVTQYYWGDRQEIQSAGVQYILDSVVQALVANPSRRFTYAEMSFFMRWWKLQDESTKKVVKKLVKEGRLDFVNGGYVQHDEAASHYVGMIDQTTRGHRFLNDTFGFVPRIGWQIDPFGHSSTQAGLLGEELGFDAFFFGRADHEDMATRKEDKTLEFLWRGSGGRASCGEEGAHGIFVGNFPSGNYGPPAGFNWEFRESSDSPIQDDPSMDGYNVPERVEDFVSRCYEIWNVTRGGDIMLTMGSDFHYSNAHAWFKNLDKLIKYVNEDGRLLAFYSTPAAYVERKQQAHILWPEKVDDFFPYSDFEQAFWTGYFTSRPTSKGYIRKLTSFLQAARQLETFMGTVTGGTDALEEAISLCQHHDSITGTEKQHVADDYHLRLHKGLEEAQQTASKALTGLLKSNFRRYGLHLDDKLNMSDNWNVDFCNLLNISVCQPAIKASRSDSGVFHVWIYNSLTYERSVPMRIPISLDKHSHWQVLAKDGHQIEAQVVPISEATRNVQKNEMGENFIQDDNLTNDLVFMAAVPPLGYSLLDVIPKSDRNITNQEGDSVHSLNKDATTISNDILKVTFDPSTGVLASIGREGMPPIDVTTTLFWYNSSDGLEAGNIREQSSGAYIFQPNGKYNVVGKNNVKLEIIRGEIVNEARQQFNEWCFLTTRLYKDKEYLEIEWTAGPLLDDGHGREVVLMYNTSISSGAEFWTDSNGRAMIRRVRNKRLTWDSKLADSIAGNFYPITSAIYIADNTQIFSVITDRAQGAASLGPGHIEIMLHRRTIVDDKRGVGENLNETFCQGDSCQGLIARGKHFLHLQSTGESALERRILQQEANDEALLAFLTDDHDSYTLNTHALGHRFSFMESLHFPPEIQILTLQRTSQDRVLLRLAHQMDSVEGASTISVQKDTLNRLMHRMNCHVLNFEELSLSGNQMIDQIERLRFKKGESIGNLSCWDVFSQSAHSAALSVDERNKLDQSNNIVLQPMQIRTYNVLCES